MKDLEGAILRSILSALLIVVAFIFLLASIGFLLVVAYRLSEPVWGAAGAAGVVAGICFGFTLFLLGVAAIVGRSRSKPTARRQERRGGGAADGPYSDGAIESVMRGWVRRSPWEALSTALIGGVVYVKVPEARSLVLRLLSTPPNHDPGVDPAERARDERARGKRDGL